jgi:outer membrane protein OmpA-like peptidoglycan-associated protein
MKNIFIYIFILFVGVSNAQTYEVVEVSYEGKVNDLKNINTPGIEFSPVWINNELIFTSSREFDLLAYGENNWKNSGYLNIYRTNIKGENINDSVKFKSTKIFSEAIKSNSHTGPICFSVTGDTLFYTQTLSKDKRKKQKEYRPQIFMAIKNGNDWDDIQLLPFNLPNYSFAHPSYNSATKTLYFTSDMPGGKGGKDVYSVKLNTSWGEPVNISHINTIEDEVFPFVVKNDIFIASNRKGGSGGLDIYWSNLNNSSKIKNFESVNTKFDDFGIFILPGMAKGFISSNRNGNDDIHFLYIEKKVTVKNELAGKFIYRNLGTDAGDLKVMLMNDEGDIVFETVTSKKGEFKFSNLMLNEGYTIKAIGLGDLDLIIYDKDGNPVARLLSDERGEFTYKKLNYNDVNTLSLIPENQSDFDAGFGFLTGQFVYANEPGKYPENLSVLLKDEKGNVKVQTLTDERGNFNFKNLSLTESYLMSIPEGNDELTLFIFDKKGNVVAQLKSNEMGQFVYRKLDGKFASGLKAMPEDNDNFFELDTKTVSGNFDYKNLEGNFKNGLTIYIYSEQGILIATEQSNEKGQFRFRNLPINDNFLFKIEENGVLLNMDDFALYIEDRYGKKVAELQRGENGYFIFKPLGFNVKNTLSAIQENEDSLSIDFKPSVLNETFEIEKVYFDSNREKVKYSDYKRLDEIISNMKKNPNLRLEINAYADSRSSDEYNLVLSGKRGRWIAAYMTSKGIVKSRFIVNAYGEGRLAIDCVDCTDEDHAKNRRAELRMY